MASQDYIGIQGNINHFENYPVYPTPGPSKSFKYGGWCKKFLARILGHPIHAGTGNYHNSFTLGLGVNVGPSYAWGPGLMSSSGANSGSVGMFRDPL